MGRPAQPEHVVPAHERRRLLAAVTDVAFAKAFIGMELTKRQDRRYKLLLNKRLSGIPVQHLEGSVPFGPLEITIDKRALIPRPETEYLWDLIVKRVEYPDIVLDMCTGSGVLALALKHSFPIAEVFGTDLSRKALSLALINADRNELEVYFTEGDMFQAVDPDIKGRVEVFVSNPPYVEDEAVLPMEVREYDPAMALFGGPDGLDFVRTIATEVGEWLAPGGLLAVEIGEGQGDTCLQLFAEFSPEIVNDMTGRPRFVFGTKHAD
jgi:release factor glutamine methyltransferase